jgi:hypothetical protein
MDGVGDWHTSATMIGSRVDSKFAKKIFDSIDPVA